MDKSAVGHKGRGNARLIQFARIGHPFIMQYVILRHLHQCRQQTGQLFRQRS